jgi:hypothetical protein
MKKKETIALFRYVWATLGLLFVFFSCGTVTYIEEVDGEDVFVAHDNIITNEQTGKKVTVHHTYLQYDRYFTPWANLEMSVSISPYREEEKFKVVILAFDIYTLNDRIIEPVEERADLPKHDVHKKYKNSFFFPKKVKVKTKVKIFYEDNYYEYFHEAVITKRYKPFWAVTA